MTTHPYLRFPWPDEAPILVGDDISNNLFVQGSNAQSVFGHLLDWLRPIKSMQDSADMRDAFVDIFSRTVHLTMKSKNPAFGDIKYRAPPGHAHANYAHTAFCFNATCCALGYTEGQDADAISVGEKAWNQLLSTTRLSTLESGEILCPRPTKKQSRPRPPKRPKPKS